MVHHGRGLRALLQQAGRSASDIDELVAALGTDIRRAVLPDADRALLEYAGKLTRTPGAMTARDCDALRQHGFDDLGIHDLCAVVAYFNFVNRIADGLGVELEAG